MEIPFDLIKQAQISLRRRANLPSYDPDGASPVGLPSAEESAAALDPSPPELRCRHCQARLLRGSQSLICVFCGREACNDVVPDPIDFRNTFGYRWLLDSLDLDGSELVSPSGEENTTHRGRTPPKDEIPLSDLLNLEIKWPSEMENFGFRLSNEKPVQRKNPVNLPGVTTEIKVGTEVHSNLSLFENARTEDDINYFDSGFGADFQSAPSRTKNAETVSFDHFVGSEDLSSHMDDVFGNAKDSESSLSIASDWFSGPSREIEVRENVNTLSTVEPDNNPDEGDDSFEDWNDFAGSTNPTMPGDEKISESDIFGSANPTQDISLFDDFSQPDDPFRGEFSTLIVSAESLPIDRAADTNTKAGDVEKILSQMHDLSFMLDGNLSVPSEQEGVNSLSR